MGNCCELIRNEEIRAVANGTWREAKFNIVRLQHIYISMRLVNVFIKIKRVSIMNLNSLRS